MPLPLPVDRATYVRLRRRSRVVTAVAVPPAAFLALNVVGSAVSDEPQIHALGAFWFLQLGVYLAVAGWLVARTWRRSQAARPHTQRLDDLGAARPGDTARGVPGIDAPSGPHRGLTGLDEPPRRW